MCALCRGATCKSSAATRVSRVRIGCISQVHARSRSGAADARVVASMAMAQPPETTQTGPAPCAPCRGTGKVISGLGGTSQEVVCPWCEGGGVQLSGHDAQAARAAAA